MFKYCNNDENIYKLWQWDQNQTIFFPFDELYINPQFQFYSTYNDQSIMVSPIVVDGGYCVQVPNEMLLHHGVVQIFFICEEHINNIVQTTTKCMFILLVEPRKKAQEIN